MRSSKSKTIAGFCRKCNSSLQLSGGYYSCQCGGASETSYYFPSSWVFKANQAREGSAAKAAKASSGNQAQ